MLNAWHAGFLVAILAALPAAAQTEPTPDSNASDDTIVVTGETGPPTRREVFDQALELSRVDPGRMYEEALARVTAPLCPEVVGLGDELANRMVERIRANASQLKLRLASRRCSPNLLVAFVDDGQQLLVDLAVKHPQIFELVSESERSEMLVDAAPVRVWNVVETKWSDGGPIPYRQGRQDVPSVRGRANQMLLPTRKDIDFALVAYDREAVVGMTIVQLADYATMRGLSHTRPATGNEPMATILALFDDEDIVDPVDRGPAELTSFDLGYLRSVYFWRPDRSVPAVGRLLSVRRRAEAAAVGSPER